MPFTFAHLALVIPLIKKRSKWFDVSALILGSMSPDFEYFIRFNAWGVFGHTLGGLLYFNLPLIFIIALLWQYIIKKPFILSLPKAIGQHLSSFYYYKWDIWSFRGIMIFIISSIIGMLSHIFWDSFTHENAYFVNRIPFLSQHISFFGNSESLYRVLQHGSTLVGIGIVLVYMYITSRKIKGNLPNVLRSKQSIYWVLVFILTSCVFMLKMFSLNNISYSYLVIYIVTFVSGLFIGLVITSYIYHLFKVYKYDST